MVQKWVAKSFQFTKKVRDFWQMISAVHDNFWELGSQDPPLFARLVVAVVGFAQSCLCPTQLQCWGCVVVVLCCGWSCDKTLNHWWFVFERQAFCEYYLVMRVWEVEKLLFVKTKTKKVSNWPLSVVTNTLKNTLSSILTFATVCLEIGTKFKWIFVIWKKI